MHERFGPGVHKWAKFRVVTRDALRYVPSDTDSGFDSVGRFRVGLFRGRPEGILSDFQIHLRCGYSTSSTEAPVLAIAGK